MKKLIEQTKGFSLLELSIVILIIGFVLTTMLNMIPVLVNNYNKIININKLEKIENAMNAYILKNSKLPKPLKINEDFILSNETTTVINNNYIGSIPILKLGLPLEYMMDNWGNKFVYVVNKNCVDNNIIDKICIGNIALDFNNNNKLENILYAIISTGKDSKGGYKNNGKEIITSLNHYNTYDTISSSSSVELKYYNNDDKIIFSTKELLNISLFWYKDCNVINITEEEIKEGCDNNIGNFDRSLNIPYRKIVNLFNYTLEEKNKSCFVECTHNGILKIYTMTF